MRRDTGYRPETNKLRFRFRSRGGSSRRDGLLCNDIGLARSLCRRFALGKNRLDLCKNLLLQLMIFLKKRFHGFTSLRKLFSVECKPLTALFDQSEIAADINDGADAGNPLIPVDVELRHLERRRQFVFDDFDFRARSGGFA